MTVSSTTQEFLKLEKVFNMLLNFFRHFNMEIEIFIVWKLCTEKDKIDIIELIKEYKELWNHILIILLDELKIFLYLKFDIWNFTLAQYHRNLWSAQK